MMIPTQKPMSPTQQHIEKPAGECKLFHTLHGLDTMQLVEIYAQSNREDAAAFYPNLEPQDGAWAASQDFLLFLQTEFFSHPGDAYAVWEVAGQYVSALRLERYWDGFLLEALETAPDRRSQGYATALVTAVLNRLEPGTMVYAHVSRRNQASMRLHQRCGFSQWEDHAIYVDGSISTQAVTLRCQTG